MDGPGRVRGAGFPEKIAARDWRGPLTRRNGEKIPREGENGEGSEKNTIQGRGLATA